MGHTGAGSAQACRLMLRERQCDLWVQMPLLHCHCFLAGPDKLLDGLSSEKPLVVSYNELLTVG